MELLRSPKFGFDAFPLTISPTERVESPEKALIGDKRCVSTQRIIVSVIKGSYVVLADHRVDRAILVCTGSPPSAEGGEERRRAQARDASGLLLRFALELVACGVRAITVVCRADKSRKDDDECDACAFLRRDVSEVGKSESEGSWTYEDEQKKVLASMLSFCVDRGDNALLQLFLANEGALRPPMSSESSSRRRHANVLVALFHSDASAQSDHHHHVSSTHNQQGEAHPYHLMYECLRNPPIVSANDDDSFGVVTLEWERMSVRAQHCVLNLDDDMKPGFHGMDSIIASCGRL